MLKEQIINLHQIGYSYNQIQKELGCSKGTISYYLGNGQKEKNLIRQQKNRNNNYHPYKRKIEFFSCVISYKDKILLNKRNRGLKLKVYHFINKGNNMKVTYQQSTFTIQDVIDKYGENPICYLTGEKININNTSEYHFDHIIPRSRGGQNTIDNLGICTKKANKSKQDMTPDELIEFCKKVLEYNGYEVKKSNTE